MIWTTAEQVIDIHSTIIARSGGLDGLRDRNGLEAAIAAPLQTFDGNELYKTDLEKITRLAYGLASNHVFIDGNKRIGAMMMQLILRWNGYDLMIKSGELADIFISIADGKAGEMKLLNWLQTRVQ